MLPVPEIALATVKLLLRLKINAPLLVMDPEPITPVVEPEPICRVPAEIVVVPEWVFAPVKTTVPVLLVGLLMVKLPVLLMMPDNVKV